MQVRIVVSLLAMLSAVAVAAHIKTTAGGHVQSRLASIESLAHRGTFVIDESLFVGTVDKVQLNGHFYSSKPPLWSLLGVGVYTVLRVFPGVGFDVDPSRTVGLLNLFLGLGPWLILLWAAWQLLQLLVTTDIARIMGFASVALGCFGAGYATTINNHVPAAAALLLGLLCVLRGKGRRDLVYAGLALGLAPALDVGAVFVSATAFFVCLRLWGWRAAAWLVAAALIPVAAHLSVTYVSTGSVLPIYLRHELYLYPGSYWLKPQGMDAKNEAWYVYLFHMLAGHHGFFSMTPLVLVGLVGCAWLWGGESEPRRKALMVATTLLTLVLIVFYAATTNNYGGACVGFRWLLIVVPWSLLCATFVVERYPTLWPGYLALLAVGVFHTHNALADPWRTSLWHRLFQHWGWA